MRSGDVKLLENHGLFEVAHVWRRYESLEDAWARSRDGDLMLRVALALGRDSGAYIATGAAVAALALDVWRACYPRDPRLAGALRLAQETTDAKVLAPAVEAAKDAARQARAEGLKPAVLVARAVVAALVPEASEPNAAELASRAAYACVKYSSEHGADQFEGKAERARVATLVAASGLVREHFPMTAALAPPISLSA